MKKSNQYKGCIINNREDIRDLVSELMNDGSVAAKGFFRLASMRFKRVTLTALTPNEAKLYTTYGVINQRAKLQMKSNALRHLLNSGHIGGKKKFGGIDKNPLTLEDIKEIRSVYKKPDIIYLRNNKIIVEKVLTNKHRLVLELTQNGKNLSVKTYYNCNKKPPKKRFSGS
ncbi:hypothetical protein IKF03_03190 [Candidatus Saccharibacteria bacterium]|nr:hypothetical protein [Candidatus Saccharibacteria bacterium]